MSAALCAIAALLAARPATVGLAGSYGHRYAVTAAGLGARVVHLDSSQLSDRSALSELDVLIVSHLHEGWPKGAPQAVSAWLRNGGVLLLEIAAWPPTDIFPHPAHAAGWGATVRILNPNSPLTATFRAGQRLRYGAWAGGLRLPPDSSATVLARWDLSDADTYQRPVSPAFSDHDVAMAEIAAGKGRVFYSGAGLFILAPNAVRRWLAEVVGQERLPLLRLNTLWSAAPTQAPDARWNGRAAVVFRDPSFPSPAMPHLPDGFIERGLREMGLSVHTVGAKELSAGTWLAPDVALLVLANGEAFPLDAVDDLKRFLAGGGAVLSVAGAPLSHLIVADTNGRPWDLGATPSSRTGTTRELYSRLGVFTKVASLAQPDGAIVVNWPNCPLPTFWPLTGGRLAFFHAPNGLNPHTIRPLVASISREGRVLGCPVAYSPRLARFPNAQFLALGFTGDSHPLNPAAWPHAATALKAFARLLLDPPQLFIADVWPRQPLYYDGEDVQVQVRLLATRRPRKVTCSLTILARDRWQEVFRATKQARISPDRPLDLLFTWPKARLDRWAYIAVAHIDATPPPWDTELASFLAWQPDFCARAAHVSLHHSQVLRAARPVWLSGANLYLADWRGVGMFFHTRNEPGAHPLVDGFDRDLGLLRLLGGNATRTHYFDLMITPATFANPRSHALRRLDAYNLLHAAHNLAAIYAPFTFVPGRYQPWRDYMKNKYGPDILDASSFAAPEWLAEEQAYYEALARRCAQSGARNILWQLINEPERYPPMQEKNAAKRRRGAATVFRWTRLMTAAISKGGYRQAGIGQSTAPLSYGWDPRGNLNELAFHDVHHYSPTTVNRRTNALWSIPFGLAYGWPATLGEYGQPNAARSRTPFLGNWLASYEAALTCVMAESAMGFLNFYLNCGMGHVDSPEWGMVRPDYTEKDAALAWKLWNWLTRRIPPDDFLPHEAALLFDPAVRLKNPGTIEQLGREYLDLLGKGAAVRIISPADVPRLIESKCLPQVVYAPDRWLLADGRRALDAVAQARARIVRQPETLVSAVHSQTRIRPIASDPQALYVRRLRGGRWYIAIVEGSGRPIVIRARGQQYRFILPQGRCATLVVDHAGAPELIAACCPVFRNGREILRGPDLGFAVWAGSGRNLLRDGATDVWAEDQQAVYSRRIKLPNDLKARPWRLEGRHTSASLLQQARRLLASRGVQISPTAEAAIVVCGPNWLKEAAAQPTHPAAKRGISLRTAASVARLFRGTSWIQEAWVGLILVDRTNTDAPTVYVSGVSEAALHGALRRLCSLRKLRDCLTSPLSVPAPPTSAARRGGSLPSRCGLSLLPPKR